MDGWWDLQPGGSSPSEMMRGSKQHRHEHKHREKRAENTSAELRPGQVLGHVILRNLTTAIAVSAESS
jgi:hypothetical protein